MFFFCRNGFFRRETTFVLSQKCFKIIISPVRLFFKKRDNNNNKNTSLRRRRQKRRKMDPLATTERFEREFREALSFNSSLSSSSDKVVKTRIQFALEAVLSATTPRDVYDAKDDEHYPFDSDEKELEKIETLAEFFYQCASVDLYPHAFDVRLENVTSSASSISEETKASLRRAYVRNKTELTKACRIMAEMEDEKTTEQLEKIEWRMSAETSSRMRQNRGRHREGRDGREEEESEGVGGDRLRYVVKVTLRSVGEKKKNAMAKRRVEVFECSYETLKKLSEDVEKCREKSEDARARRIRRFVKRPT